MNNSKSGNVPNSNSNDPNCTRYVNPYSDHSSDIFVPNQPGTSQQISQSYIPPSSFYPYTPWQSTSNHVYYPIGIPPIPESGTYSTHYSQDQMIRLRPGITHPFQQKQISTLSSEFIPVDAPPEHDHSGSPYNQHYVYQHNRITYELSGVTVNPGQISYPDTTNAFRDDNLSFTELLPHASTSRSAKTSSSFPSNSLNPNVSNVSNVDFVNHNYISNYVATSISRGNYSPQSSSKGLHTSSRSFERPLNETIESTNRSEFSNDNSDIIKNRETHTVESPSNVSNRDMRNQSFETQIVQEEIQCSGNTSKYPRLEGSEDLLIIDRITGGGIPGTDDIIIDATWVKILGEEENNAVSKCPALNEDKVTLEDFLKESVKVTESSTTVEFSYKSTLILENSPLDNSNSPTTESTANLHAPSTTTTEDDTESSSIDINDLIIENVDAQVHEPFKDSTNEVNLKIDKSKRKRKAKKVETKQSSKKSKISEKDNLKSREIDNSEADLVTAFTNTIAESAMMGCLQTIAVNESLIHIRDALLESACKNIAQYFARMNIISYFYETRLKKTQSSAIFHYAKDLLRKRLIISEGRIPREILQLYQVNHLQKLVKAIRTKSTDLYGGYSSTTTRWKNLDPDDMILHAEQIASDYYRRTKERIPGIDIISILLLCPSRITIYRYYIKNKKKNENIFFQCIKFIRTIAELGGLATCLFAKDQFVLEKVLPLFSEQLEASARDFGRLSIKEKECFINKVKLICQDFCNEVTDEEEKDYKMLLVSSLSLNFKVFGSLIASGNQNRERVLPAVVSTLILDGTSDNKISNISTWVKLLFQTSFGTKVLSFVRRQPQEQQFSMYENIVSTFIALVSQMPKFLKKEGFKDPMKVFEEFGEEELDLLQVEDKSLSKILNSVMDIASRHFNFEDSFKEYTMNEKSKEISEEMKVQKEQEIYIMEMMRKYNNIELSAISTDVDLAELIDESFNHHIPKSFRIVKFPSVGKLTSTGEAILNDALETFWTFMKVYLNKSTLFKFFLQCPLLFNNGYEDFILNGSITGEPVQAMVNLMQMISFPNYNFKTEFIQNRKSIFYRSLISSFRVCYGGQIEGKQMTPYIQALADGFRVLYRMQDIRLQKCPEGIVIYGCLLSFICECKDIDISALGKELINTIRCHRLDSNVTVDFMIIVRQFVQRFCKEVKDYYLIQSKETNPFQLPNVLSSGQIGWQMLQCIALEKLVHQNSMRDLIWILCKTSQERDKLMDLTTKIVRETQIAIDNNMLLNDPIPFGFLEQYIIQEFKSSKSEKWIDTETILDFVDEIKEKFNFQCRQSAIILLMAAILWTHPNMNITMRLSNIISINTKLRGFLPTYLRDELTAPIICRLIEN